MSDTGLSAPPPPHQTVRLWVSWLLVAAMLGYGVVQTAITAAKLFTH